MTHPCLACHGSGYEPGYNATGAKQCRFCHGTGAHQDVEPEVCPVCEGTGYSQTFTEHGAEVCWYCHGTGYMPRDEAHVAAAR